MSEDVPLSQTLTRLTRYDIIPATNRYFHIAEKGLGGMAERKRSTPGTETVEGSEVKRPDSTEGTEAIERSEVAQRQQTQTKVIAIIVAVVIVAALGFGGYELFVHPTWAQVLRDIFIILMAVESLAIGILLIVLIVYIIKLTTLLQEEILPILNSTNETVSTVKQTTTFVSDVVVSPLIKTLSTLSAVRGGARAIFRRRRSHNEKSKSENRD